MTQDFDARLKAKREAKRAKSPTHGEAEVAQEAANGVVASVKKATDRARWRAYNEFHDLIAARLSLADGAVWNQMHRHCEGGEVKVTARRIAKAAGIQRTTASRSLKRLAEVGLVWVVWLATDKSKPSIYGMSPSPGGCLSRLPARDEDKNEPSA